MSHEIGIRRRRRGHVRDPAQSDGLQQQAGSHQPVAADPIRQRAGDRRDEDRHRRPREDAQPRLERRVALHGLEELRK
jgi:hypothetical protein